MRQDGESGDPVLASLVNALASGSLSEALDQRAAAAGVTIGKPDAKLAQAPKTTQLTAAFDPIAADLALLNAQLESAEAAIPGMLGALDGTANEARQADGAATLARGR